MEKNDKDWIWSVNSRRLSFLWRMRGLLLLTKENFITQLRKQNAIAGLSGRELSKNISEIDESLAKNKNEINKILTLFKESGICPKSMDESKIYSLSGIDVDSIKKTILPIKEQEAILNENT